MPKFPPEGFPQPPKPPRLSKLLKETNPVREIIQDVRDLIKSGRDEVAGIASALRVEGQVAPPKPGEEAETETKQEESTASLEDLRAFLEQRKAQGALARLAEAGDKEDVDILRRYIEGEDV